jgi:hypothetical protein
MNILEKIIEHKKGEVDHCRQNRPVVELEKEPFFPAPNAFVEKLAAR